MRTANNPLKILRTGSCTLTESAILPCESNDTASKHPNIKQMELPSSLDIADGGLDTEVATCIQNEAQLRSSKDRKWRRELGISYQDLNVSKSVPAHVSRATVSSFLTSSLRVCQQLLVKRTQPTRHILKNCEGLVQSGELVLVLGKPGSGCTTLLKILGGRTSDLLLNKKSNLNYQGIPEKLIQSEFRGEYNYQPEFDLHFPTMTVAQTLSFAANARSIGAVSNSVERAIITMASALGLSSVLQSKVGDDFVRGISGGERHRTSVAETLLCGASLQCWEDVTRGLDSLNALELIKVLRTSAKNEGSAHVVTMNQASQDAYNLFDKVVLLYEGQQIYFGEAGAATKYFNDLGFLCQHRYTTSDFLTSITNPVEVEQFIKPGHEGKVPKTPDDFASIWRKSSEREVLQQSIRSYNERFPIGEKQVEAMRKERKARRASGCYQKSPYNIKFHQQIHLCVTRGFQRLLNNLAPPISALIGNAIVSLILGSVFYNMPEDTSSFFSRGALIFFTIMTNTFLGAFEGAQLWAERPIMRKQFYSALYYPSAEAVASMICDIPNKILLTLSFNLPVYFISNMRRTPQAFLTFYLFALTTLLNGSMLFRLISTISKTLMISIAPGAHFVLLLVIYTGFVLPMTSMHPWLRWVAYLDPVGYAFESLMINEFSDRSFLCTSFVPEGPHYIGVSPDNKMCAIAGATSGQIYVDGDAYLAQKFRFRSAHLWSNLGIAIGLMALLCTLYLFSADYISMLPSRNATEFQNQYQVKDHNTPGDEENFDQRNIIRENKEMEPESLQTERLATTTAGHAAFLWDSLSYEVKTKAGTVRVLDDLEGWIKPGTLTALMGASGAGKTSLLNVLADRTTVGVIGGQMMTDSKYKNDGFAAKVAYAQQQDLHLPTSTVREALILSAHLRQPKSYSEREKLDWVEQLIGTLDMSSFSDSLIGVPGDGLSTEQRKHLTIGVELAARPELLLFLDEPTSGLDNSTAWLICNLLRKLASQGQQILCTIHQPSGALFQMFDRLILLHEGRCLYFGDLGLDSRTVIRYFEQKGARKCEPAENPAEWLLETTKTSTKSWSNIWNESEERRIIKQELNQMKRELMAPANVSPEIPRTSTEFATPLWYQLWILTVRNLRHNWRTPSYLYSRVLLTVGASYLGKLCFHIVLHPPGNLSGPFPPESLAGCRAFEKGISTAVLLGVCILSAAGRFYIRITVHKQFSIDDFLLILGFCCVISGLGTMYPVLDGLYMGQAILSEDPLVLAQIPPNWLEIVYRYHKLVSISGAMIWCAIICVKFSFLFFFRKLIDRINPMITYWRVTMGLTVGVLCYGLTTPFLTCPHFYSIKLLECPQHSKRAIDLSIAQMILDVLSDLLITIIRASGLHYGKPMDAIWEQYWLLVSAEVGLIMTAATTYRSFFVSRNESHRNTSGESSPSGFISLISRVLPPSWRSERSNGTGEIDMGNFRSIKPAGTTNLPAESFPSCPGVIGGIRTLIRSQGRNSHTMSDTSHDVDHVELDSEDVWPLAQTGQNERTIKVQHDIWSSSEVASSTTVETSKHGDIIHTPTAHRQRRRHREQHNLKSNPYQTNHINHCAYYTTYIPSRFINLFSFIPEERDGDGDSVGDGEGDYADGYEGCEGAGAAEVYEAEKELHEGYEEEGVHWDVEEHGNAEDEEGETEAAAGCAHYYVEDVGEGLTAWSVQDIG
ncbi:hypothetical protein G7Y89_g4480 [Cudoniella acicularis]|uniref:ABC transporter domain-containing protein n=1 Tax=Cudoniella acicularis TaxID=354080 RepID=A0A8H4RRI7_9HELO|nr:hypothetical protein G7Y89_g4480 [Cudoniella acicularis]